MNLRAVHAELAEIDPGVERIDGGDELESGRVEYGSAHGGTHLPRGTEDPDPDAHTAEAYAANSLSS
jgi:hypothetical protein